MDTFDSRRCKKCNIMKNTSEFYSRNRKTTIYLSPECITCIKIERKNVYENNKEQILKQSKLNYHNNKEQINNKNKEWRKQNPEKNKECGKKYYEKNKHKKQNYNKIYYETNKEKIITQHKEYIIRNKDRIREYFRNYVSNRSKKDIDFKIMRRLRSRLNMALNKDKNEKTVKLIGCSIIFFRNWIEYQFNEFMNWSNYGSYWNIDHVIPCASFDLTIVSEQFECFNWKNCRPLKSEDNISKGSSILQNDIEEQEFRVINYLQHIQIAGTSLAS